MAWCRLWDDLIKDKELQDMGLEYVGAYVHLLILANKCRREGQYIQPDLTDVIGDRTLSKEEIIRGTNIEPKHFDKLAPKFLEHKKGIYSVKNWDKYQGDAERIRKLRK